MAGRDARREKALAHNEVARALRLELEASAGAARTRLVDQRRAMTAGLAPEEVRAIDAARDAQFGQARAREAARKDLAARQARPLRDRGLDRGGPGLGM